MRESNRMRLHAMGCFLVLAAASVGAAGGVSRDEPQDASATVSGQRLPLEAKSTRSMLFVDVYSVGIYLPPTSDSLRAVRDSSVTKAIRVHVLYGGSMPKGVPPEWWAELVPALGPEQERRLKEAFSRLSSGEDVWITYAPDAGTRIRLQGAVVITDKGHGLMNAVLDLWLGPTPVSSEVHEELRTQLMR